MTKHIPTLGILFIVWGAFQALVGIVFPLIYVGLGAAMGFGSGDDNGLLIGGILASAGVLVGGLLLLMAIPNVVAGIGIRRHKKWARILGIVMAALAITSFPFGTALGIYAFVVLLDKDVGLIFQGPAAEAG